MFTAGDRIRVTNKKSEFYGYEGAFIRRNDSVVIVQLDGVPQRYAFFPENIVGIPPTNEKNKKIKIGDRLRATKDIIFCGAPGHYAGSVYTAEESTRAYFQWAMENRPGEYELIPEITTYRVLCISTGSLTGNIYETILYDTLADAIVNAYEKVDEFGWHSATVHKNIEVSSPMLYGAFRREFGIESVKSRECRVTRAEMCSALKTMLCER